MNQLINKIYKEYYHLIKNILNDDTTFDYQLEKVGKKLFKHRFIGVFPCDRLPNIKNREMYIANLDSSDKKGSHWIAVYKYKKLYVFDSFGRSSKKIFPSVFGINENIQDTEYDAEQKKNKNDCGLHSMTALYMFDNFDPSIVSKYL